MKESLHPVARGEKNNSPGAHYQITAIMTALNEEENAPSAIKECLAAFERHGVDGEILFFDDCSSDGTLAAIRPLVEAHPNIRVMRNEICLGVGGCFWKGVKHCDSDFVVWVAGDNEESFDVFRYAPLFKHVDIVIPFVFNREVRPIARRALSKVYKTIINLSFRLLLNYQNGAVMYRRKILEDLHLKYWGFFYNTELLIKTLRVGYLYAEVPISIKPRRSGASKAVTLRSFIAVVRGYLGTLYAVYFSGIQPGRFHPESVTFGRRGKAADEAAEARDPGRALDSAVRLGRRS